MVGRARAWLGVRPWLVLVLAMLSALALPAAAPASSDLVQCYKCHSVADRNCRVGSCTGQVCVKSIAGNYVSKGCGKFENLRSDSEQSVYGCRHELILDVPVISCYCNTKYCNSGLKRAPTASLLLVSLLFLFFL